MTHSLAELCSRVLERNISGMNFLIKAIHHLYIPVHLITRLLRKSTAKELDFFEREYQIHEQSNELWKFISFREFRIVQKDIESGELQEPSDWRGFYHGKVAEFTEKRERLSSKLKEMKDADCKSRISKRIKIVRAVTKNESKIPQKSGFISKTRNLLRKQFIAKSSAIKLMQSTQPYSQPKNPCERTKNFFELLKNVK
jgi:hypothetical protein